MKPSLPPLLLSLAVFGVAGASSVQKAPVSFGRDVRPILSERCFKCHGPDVAKAAAGLRLDTFEGATKRAIVPGDPKASILLGRVAEHDPEMRMPPSDSGVPALAPAQVETLREWIAQGAKYERHWAFVPPAPPPLPKVSEPKWARNPIDLFVMKGLDEAGMKPEPEADRDTLALRAAQALTGLPPSPAELARFRADAKPGAYERYVDRLLASPAYGEHEARYWLDAVRYGDTHGLQLDNERGVHPYRDWVVRAFNEDLPFDRFVRWQIAGDLLPNPTTEQMIATGYVRMNLTTNEGGAIAEEFLARNTFDRVDTTSTVMLGLTVGCAKCHDHKYDPLSQRDYYGLYAYFNSTQDEPLDGNVALPPPVVRATTPEQERRLKAISVRQAALRAAVDPARAAAWLRADRQPVPATRDWAISPAYASSSFDKAFDGEVAPGEWKPFPFESGKDHNGIVGKDNASVYVRSIVSLPTAGGSSGSAPKGRPSPAQGGALGRTASPSRSPERATYPLTMLVRSDDGVKVWLNGRLIHSNKVSRGLATGFDVVRADFRAGDNELVVKVTNGGAPDGLNLTFARPDDARIDKALAASDKPELRELFLKLGPGSTAQAYRRLGAERAEIEAAPMTLVARERDKPRPTFLLRRGEYDQPGEAVQRHIPPALGTLGKGLSNDRLGLATWMTDPANPLVARVFVNRVWQQHFGTGIVKTVEDFGNQGEQPANPALLDDLAVRFVRDGWSVKRLNRRIVTSAAFRQGSRIAPAKLAKDPENRLVSRGPRFRLDAEVIRDKALEAGGLLVQRLGGRGVKPYQPDGLWENSSDPASGTHFYVRDRGEALYRRSLYLFWKRTSPPPLMLTLDAPLRDTCVVRRAVTDTPLQALALLNEPAFLEASRTMAARVLRASGDDAKRLRAAFDLAFGRAPRPAEAALLTRSLARYRQRYGADPDAARKLLSVGDAPQDKALSAPEQATWTLVCSSLMNTDEFVTQH